MGRGNRSSGDWNEPDEGRYPYEDDEYEYEPRPRRRPPYPPHPSHPSETPRRTSRDPYLPPRARRRPRRRRRVWPFLLTGCGLGALAVVIAAAVVVFLAFRSAQSGGTGIGIAGINNTQVFTQQATQTIPVAILPTIAQMQICDKIGNVSVVVDPAAQQTTVTTIKSVHAMSQSAADQEFQRIAVEVQPPGTVKNALTCAKPQPTATPSANGATSISASSLTVNVTIPDGEGLLRSSSDAVDIKVSLPEQVLPSAGPNMLLNIEAPVGDIHVDGLSGILSIKGSTGNITVEHAILADGSHIETDQGNVNFNGLLAAPSGPNAQARYIVQSEQGNIDVTLPANTNVILDANTNVGAINSEFPLDIKNTGGPVNFHGPLNPSAGTQPPATLVLDVSTGSVNIHKAQT